MFKAEGGKAEGKKVRALEGRRLSRPFYLI